VSVMDIPTPTTLLRTAAAASYLDIRERTLETWRARGEGPPFVRISRRAVRYRLSDLLAWAAEHVVDPGSRTGE